MLMLTDEERERSLAFWLRAITVGMFVAGAAIVVAGYLPRSAIYLGLLLLPGLAVLWRPRWAPILIWVGWAIPWAFELLSLAFGAEPLRLAHAGSAEPAWPMWLTYLLLAAIVCGLVTLPILRVGHASFASRFPITRGRHYRR
jgi:hypothetical protein